MKTWLTCLVLAMALRAGSTISAHAVTIDWVTVGNPGNANDTTGYGAVASSYQIGKYDVTIEQYADFLNAAAKSDPYGLWNSNMETNLTIAGIARGGSDGTYAYSVIGPSGTTPAGASSSGNRPITYVSWWDAARFANWMQNGQGSGSTETGAYTLGGATSGNAVAKNAAATFYIPAENEWYKAAYYSPTLNSGAGGYYTYATQSDTVPGNVMGGGANQANYRPDPDYRLSVTQSGSYSASQNYLTDVGAFSNSASYYGTFDQTGNVFQWNDLDGTSGTDRGLRGGDWTGFMFNVTSSFWELVDPSNENSIVGFRLGSPVTVPEPSTVASLLAGLACGGYLVRRRRKRV